MFRRLSEPLPLSEASLLALRPALNAPVLNVGFLPVGPARAAVVVFAEEWGGIGVSIGIRSNQGGQVAVFRNQESIEPDVTVAAALEPALAEAERMGFLFDEDMVENASTGQSQAMALWGRLMGEVEASSPPPATATRLARSEPAQDQRPPAVPAPLRDNTAAVAESIPEFVLEDLAEIEISGISLDVESGTSERIHPEPTLSPQARSRAARPNPEPAPEATPEAEPLVLKEAVEASPPRNSDSASARAALPQRTQLSKFRNLDEKASGEEIPKDDDAETNDRGSKLGRIPLVRVRRGRDGTKRVPYLAKLLSSF